MLAQEARLDLFANGEVGELRDARLTRGAGSVSRMNWIAEADQPRSLTVQFSVSALGWRPFEVRFTPTGSGEITLKLMGVWHARVNQAGQSQEVLWDALECDGAELVNGSFEQAEAGIPRGWQGTAGALVLENDRVAAVDGRRYVKTWHNDPVVARWNLVAGRPVILRGYSRAAFSPGFQEMKRGTARDTPAHRAARRFRRGINLANDLEAPPGQDWGVRYSAEDLQQIRQEGFDHVRIPIGWHHYTGAAPGYRLKSEIFQRVDGLVAEAQRLGLGVMVNIHHFDEFTSNPTQERLRFITIWRQLAEHYAQETEAVAFELLNEPKDAATTTLLNDIYAEALHEIRHTNPQRTVFIGPGLWNSPEQLVDLRLPDDDWNLIATVHSYLPMYFTHQGANWSGPDFMLVGVQFPGPPATPLRIPPRGGFKPYVMEWIARYNTLPPLENPSGPRALEETISRAKEWSEYYGRPVHVGEFGAITKADAASRANYCRAFRERLEAAEIGWALWDWKAAFRYWNPHTHQPEPGLREALFGK